MEFVIDLQGFKAPTDEFILKEFSIIRADEKNAQPLTLFFEPPYAWNALPTKYRTTNKWLERNFHGMSWEYGIIPYDAAKAIIQSILQHARSIFVKGYEKSLWLANFLDTAAEIIDLETLDCPSLKRLPKTPSNCPHHTITSKFNCATRNVIALKSWLYVYHALCKRGIF